MIFFSQVEIHGSDPLSGTVWDVCWISGDVFPQAPFKYHRVSEFALPGLWHGLERINNGSWYFHRDGPGSFGNVSCMKNL